MKAKLTLLAAACLFALAPALTAASSKVSSSFSFRRRALSCCSTSALSAASGRTRVLCSHDPSGGLAEADVVLGLRAGRCALLRAAAQVSAEEIAELYR